MPINKWIVKGYDPKTKKYWYIAGFKSKHQARRYIRKSPGLHMGNLHKGGE